MEIMKVFSSYDDYGYEEERLYSVLMDENELALFSEIQKEYSLIIRKIGSNAVKTPIIPTMGEAKRALMNGDNSVLRRKASLEFGSIKEKHRNEMMNSLKKNYSPKKLNSPKPISRNSSPYTPKQFY